MKYVDIPVVIMLLALCACLAIYYGAKYGWHVGFLAAIGLAVLWFAIGKYAGSDHALHSTNVLEVKTSGI